MRRKRDRTRPPIPDWVVCFADWNGLPEGSFLERRWRWSAELWEWLDENGYNVFELDDAEVEYRQRTRRRAR